jgi:hypothetical protein
MVYGSILTEDKNSTREWGGEDREVAAPRPPKVVVPGRLQQALDYKSLWQLVDIRVV